MPLFKKLCNLTQQLKIINQLKIVKEYHLGEYEIIKKINQIKDKFRRKLYIKEEEIIVTDIFGFFVCGKCHSEISGILLFLEEIIDFAQRIVKPLKYRKIFTDVFTSFVFLHELSHLLIHVHLPQNLRKPYAEKYFDYFTFLLEEPICEAWALYSLSSNQLKFQEINANVDNPYLNDSTSKLYFRSSIGIIQRLSRLKPYNLWPYAFAEIAFGNKDIPFAALFHQINAICNDNVTDVIDILSSFIVNDIKIDKCVSQIKFLAKPSLCTQYDVYIIS